METLQVKNVQIPSAHFRGSRTDWQQLSSSKNSLSLASVSKLQGSGRNILLSNNQNNHLLLSKDASVSTHRIRCCAAPAHPPLNGCLPATCSTSGSYKVHAEDMLLLKKRGADLVSDLRGTCIYLVGMMGSGKSTVGKVLADALEYQFVDSDKVIEEAAGGVSVAELFKQQDEMSFRCAETQALKQLSCSVHLVVATGGGIVIRPENWSYMRYGVSVYLDVPLESLAERVVAAGTHSRPLLGGETRGTSAYTQALERLSTIYENRASCYANADAKVSLQKLATSLGYQVGDLTPTLIAMQTLEEIKELLIHRKQREK
ncbi:hypothetical protein GOP47_0006118 [Adiantum capillus-veneris]|uniref:shikimate kinase n=1 Tax=Adiantum capillus-veneris TaxID=13818 RepID=A0A9D4V3T0_ADICA|nr:hypothetical protein GOP47_0006118 [Adiantum capillus-veneris]